MVGGKCRDADCEDDIPKTVWRQLMMRGIQRDRSSKVKKYRQQVVKEIAICRRVTQLTHEGDFITEKDE